MRILERKALFVERDTPIHIDVSDISKPHAGKMPCLCKVRDASDPRKPIRRVGRLAMTLLRPADGAQVVRSRFASRASTALSSTSQSHARATTPVH